MDKNVCVNCDYNKMWGGNCEYEQEEKCIYATARYLTHDDRKNIEKKLIMIEYLLDDRGRRVVLKPRAVKPRIIHDINYNALNNPLQLFI